MKLQIEFNRKTKQLIEKAKAQTWAFSAFTNCYNYANIISKNLSDEKTQVSRSALSKALVTDYCKIFSSDSREGFSNKFLTKNENFDQKSHKIINDLRNVYVAHSDVGYEPQSHSFHFSRVLNADAASTVKYVELPVILKIESGYFMGFNSADIVKKIEMHVENCAELCKREAQKTTKELARLCIENYEYVSTVEGAFVLSTTMGGIVDGSGLRKLSRLNPPKTIKNISKDDLLFYRLGLDIGIQGVEEFEDDKVKIKPKALDGSTTYSVLFKKED